MVLESRYRHDFNSCNCENQTFIDGGLDYTRCGGADMEMIEFLPSCEKCGCRLDDKPTILFAYESKLWSLCTPCYEIMKEE